MTKAKLALFFSHPMLLMFTSVLGTFIAVRYSLASKLHPDQVWLSEFVSLVIGLPAIWCTKRLIRKDIESYADFSLSFASRKRRDRKVHGKSALVVLPIFIAFIVSNVAVRYLRLPYLPVLGMLIVLSIFCYPEQEMVYLKAKRKLEELAKKDGNCAGSI